jgi:hypothetical protein
MIRKRRWQESPVAGESTKEAVKTIARGKPGDSGWTCGDYARVLFYFAHEAAGAAAHPAFPAPSFWREKESFRTRTRFASRECGVVFGMTDLRPRHCLRQTQSVCARERIQQSNPVLPWRRHPGARVERANFDVQLHIRESITTIASMDSGSAPTKSAVADLVLYICRTRVNPSSGGASRNDETLDCFAVARNDAMGYSR